jgi:hypothetical protein
LGEEHGRGEDERDGDDCFDEDGRGKHGVPFEELEARKRVAFRTADHPIVIGSV